MAAAQYFHVMKAPFFDAAFCMVIVANESDRKVTKLNSYAKLNFKNGSAEIVMKKVFEKNLKMETLKLL